jgi:hypothetical protein
MRPIPPDQRWTHQKAPPPVQAVGRKRKVKRVGLTLDVLTSANRPTTSSHDNFRTAPPRSQSKSKAEFSVHPHSLRTRVVMGKSNFLVLPPVLRTVLRTAFWLRFCGWSVVRTVLWAACWLRLCGWGVVRKVLRTRRPRSRDRRGLNRHGSAGALPYQCGWYSIGCGNEAQSHGRANLLVSRGGSDRLRWKPQPHAAPVIFYVARCRFVGKEQLNSN